jgi:hypothetical protein
MDAVQRYDIKHLPVDNLQMRSRKARQHIPEIAGNNENTSAVG